MAMPTQPTTLPIIDIGPYLSKDPDDIPKRVAVSAALHTACVEYGFFYLDISSFVPKEVPEGLTDLARTFFYLPQEEKEKISLRNEDSARGYARLKENVTNGKADNHEGIDFYKPVSNPDKTKPLWGENQWPSVPGFRDKYEQWVDKMKTLGMIVMEAVQYTRFAEYSLGYPPLPNDYDGFSCGAHKDYGCLTFLHADPTPSALQVFLRKSNVTQKVDTSNLPAEQGDEEGSWIVANPIPGCVVCNIGEMWEIWTNGLYRSTLHRVIHRGSNYRIPFFFEPNFDAVVKPLSAALRRQGHSVPHREGVVYGDFLLAKVGNNFTESDAGSIPDQ
ncbi:hypothetical protein AMATHDRAFT_72926 [Amanita thiersii Skay4041]|uniref:Fe2OG dioxygenase domain-containing protein n=1 Tax=Amanita thiersii Skay4041 TaxID=703135 RepID=A0A2A9NUW3_9AGAR|nr:hypothetical protein AMATHDRAFT_72926 [Amanita thiersii Skay4041]